MNKKIERMYVHPDFKKMIRKQAIEEDLDTLSFTKKLALENDENNFNRKNKNAKFQFKF